MPKRLRAGVIGVGTFGSQHARVYAELESVDLVAVSDLRTDRLDDLTKRYNVKAYTDFNDLLNKENLDLVSICTSDEFHVEPVLSAVNSGVNVLVEKPLAMTVSDCDTIIYESDKAGVKLMVGHILRFDPRYYTARQSIANGQIGNPVHFSARRNNLIKSAERLGQHTSVAFFLGIHDVDFMNWCIGSKVERVYAESNSCLLKDIGTADSCLALIKYQHGTIASLEVSWILPNSFSKRLDAQFVAVGTEGAVYVDGSGQAVEIYLQDESYCPDVMYAPEIGGRYTGILRDEIAHFVDCVMYDKKPSVSGQDGKEAVKVVCAITESLKTNQPVYL